ncbi:5-methyltetrahydropteroyltriglutamate--homocysteine S-methyltransferase [uncultured Treponema sp.]|uniref:5-methyltetrahydropteroyltriglutamate-- homocysteine S-methyltransferase n=1 Tax=uncultured Treponema sp. TaxID=162155 RepID=UPI002586BE3C|nr:5-methyltetrahydropteroyltriglutamate--homocysteine S-methyltransferase [uncultured Treponema sp.]
MSKTRISVIGYPRIGSLRELKFASEKYFAKEISQEELNKVAHELKLSNWHTQKNDGIDFISSNDFSFYDGMLDTAFMLGAIPERYKKLGLSKLDTFFAMARGYQEGGNDVTALPMKKWFNTNYHYIVPEFDDSTELALDATKILEEFNEAKETGTETKINVIGPYTFLKLAHYKGTKNLSAYAEKAANLYKELLAKAAEAGAKWVQIEEPALVHDTTADDRVLFEKLYKIVLDGKKPSVLLETYFGDIRDSYKTVTELPFDAIGLDFIEGKETLNLLQKEGFPKDKILFAGVVNGKNIWKNNYAKTIELVNKIKAATEAEVVLSTSCSLLHVPYTIRNEIKLSSDILKHFSFAREKLFELTDLSRIIDGKDHNSNLFNRNQDLFKNERVQENSALASKINGLGEKDYTRLPAFEERGEIQKNALNLPLFPTTTIGSFPQTKDVRANRSAFKKGQITAGQYKEFNKNKIAECIKLQEELGLDVLVHGEYERNDMVEYFGENLEGFLFTEKAWVQSYGTRCVKPPVVWGDVSRKSAITVEWSTFAQSCTSAPVKGMLTGPVTILNWSFPREDISLKTQVLQIALAIREEVLDLEKNGIKIIQIDEAALREKLPLRHSDWHTEYLDWAIPAFRLVHSGVRPETQIHTHMCYSEFNDIIKDIDNMDADVITFEASRGDLTILSALKENNFRTQVGPGVYDIHSPRVPTVEEIVSAVKKMENYVPKQKLWINPDCGLKTRGEKETVASLKNLVAAAKIVRNE